MSEEITNADQDNTAAAGGENVGQDTGQNEGATQAESQQNKDLDTQQQTEKQDSKPEGAPEAYEEFKVPEGFSVPTDDFKAWAKEQNMTQESAQNVVDFYVTKIVPQQQAAQQAQVDSWVKESETKYGKDGIEAANQALGRFSTPEFVSFLQSSGLGNHPEMVGIFKTISEKISESGLVDGKAIQTKTLAQKHFPNSDHNT